MGNGTETLVRNGSRSAVKSPSVISSPTTDSLPTKSLAPRSDATFGGFGPSLIPRLARRKATTISLPADRMDARRMIRELCPREPGVYGMLDGNDRLTYVGKSKLLRNRLLSYLAKNPSDEKMAKIIRQARKIVWEPNTHELLALIREQELITRWTPSMNRQGQPLQRKPVFLCVSNGNAPHVFSTSRVSKRVAKWFGPIRGSGQTSAAAMGLNYAFGLRDCADNTGFDFCDQLELFPVERTAACLRHELGSCLGPCASEVTRSNYQQYCQQAVAFMSGEDVSILERTRLEMNEAANSRAFERAAILRDRFDQLSWLDRRLSDLRDSRRDLHAIYPIPGFGRRPIWLLLNNSFLVHAVKAPQGTNNPEKAWLEIADRIDASRRRNQEHPPMDTHAVLLQLIVVSWFRNHKADKNLLIPYGAAIKDMQTRLSEKLPARAAG